MNAAPAATADTRSTARPFRIGIGELAGSVPDLVILVPLATAPVLVNGLDAGSVLIFAELM